MIPNCIQYILSILQGKTYTRLFLKKNTKFFPEKLTLGSTKYHNSLYHYKLLSWQEEDIFDVIKNVHWYIDCLPLIEIKYNLCPKSHKGLMGLVGELG